MFSPKRHGVPLYDSGTTRVHRDGQGSLNILSDIGLPSLYPSPFKFSQIISSGKVGPIRVWATADLANSEMSTRLESWSVLTS